MSSLFKKSIRPEQSSKPSACWLLHLHFFQVSKANMAFGSTETLQFCLQAILLTQEYLPGPISTHFLLPCVNTSTHTNTHAHMHTHNTHTHLHTHTHTEDGMLHYRTDGETKQVKCLSTVSIIPKVTQKYTSLPHKWVSQYRPIMSLLQKKLWKGYFVAYYTINYAKSFSEKIA